MKAINSNERDDSSRYVNIMAWLLVGMLTTIHGLIVWSGGGS